MWRANSQSVKATKRVPQLTAQNLIVQDVGLNTVAASIIKSIGTVQASAYHKEMIQHWCQVTTASHPTLGTHRGQCSGTPWYQKRSFDFRLFRLRGRSSPVPLSASWRSSSSSRADLGPRSLSACSDASRNNVKSHRMRFDVFWARSRYRAQHRCQSC